MKLGVIDYIDCAHFIPGHDKCGSLHGHTYKVEVIIEGDNRSGMIIDFAELKKSIKETLKLYDHKTLNDILEFPSVENICESIKSKLIYKSSTFLSNNFVFFFKQYLLLLEF